MERETATAGNDRARRGRVVAVVAGLGILAAALVVWLTRDLDRWSVAPLAVLAAFTTLSVLTDIPTGASKVRLSGVLIGMVLAIVLLGPGPAAIAGAITMLLAWLRTRPRCYFVLATWPRSCGSRLPRAVSST